MHNDQFRPGDVVNGHRLTVNGEWVRATPPPKPPVLQRRISVPIVLTLLLAIAFVWFALYSVS